MSANSALSEMFDRYTVSEWMEQKVYPMHSKLVTIRKSATMMRTVRSWPARPYQPLAELEQLGVGMMTTVGPVVVLTDKQRHRVQPPNYYSSRGRGG